MPSTHDPVDCLADILDNIERIEQYVAGLQRDVFANDGRTRDAVERCLERICEAAFRLGDSAGDRPWHDIRGMGNWLRHAYDRIDTDTVWDTIQHNMPNLKTDAERALRTLQARTPARKGKAT